MKLRTLLSDILEKRYVTAPHIFDTFTFIYFQSLSLSSTSGRFHLHLLPVVFTFIYFRSLSLVSTSAPTLIEILLSLQRKYKLTLTLLLLLSHNSYFHSSFTDTLSSLIPQLLLPLFLY